MGDKAVKEIYEACKEGNLEYIKEYIENKEGKNDIDKIKINDEGSGMMHIAAKYNNVEIMEYLYKKGGKIDICDKKECTPLFYANNSDSITFLVSNGANINAKDIYEYSPLAVKLWESNLEAAEMLLLCRADINAKMGARGYTLLQLLTERNNVESVKFILEKEGISIMRTDRNGENIMYTCLENNRIMEVICEYAIKNNILIKLLKTLNEKGDNILHCYSIKENSDSLSLEKMVKKTLSISYSLLFDLFNQKNKKNGDTPIHCSVRSKNLNYINTLLKFDNFFRIETQNNEGDTVLHMAIRTSDHNIIDSIIKYVTEISIFTIINNNDESIINIAEKIGNKNIIKKLNILYDRLNCNRIERYLTKMIRKNIFTVVLTIPNTLNYSLFDNIYSIIDVIYSKGGSILALTNNISQFHELYNNYKLRTVMDTDNIIAEKYDLLNCTKKKSFIKRLFSSGKKKTEPPSLPIGILVFDDCGSIIFSNRSFNDLYIHHIFMIIIFLINFHNSRSLSFNFVTSDNIFDSILKNNDICSFFASSLVSCYNKHTDLSIDTDFLINSIRSHISSPSNSQSESQKIFIQSIYTSFILANKSLVSPLSLFEYPFYSTDISSSNYHKIFSLLLFFHIQIFSF